MQQQNELPEGWIKTTFSNCVDILDNRRIPVNSKERKKRIGNIPYYGATGQVGWIDDFLFDEELLLLGEDGAPFFDKTKSIAYIIKGKSWVNNHAHVSRALENITSNSFLKNYFNYFDFNGFVTGTTRYKLNQSSMKTIPVTLPPLAEQHRIVSAIEAFFARLDAANERFDRASEILKTFRQSLLTAACDGRLTEVWREENPSLGFVKDFARMESFSSKKSIKNPKKEVPKLNQNELQNIPESWMWINFSKLICKIKRGPSKKCNQKGHGIRYITSGNIHGGKLRLDVDNKYLQDFANPEKCRLKPRDLILNCVNSFDKIGKSCVYPELEDEAIVGFNNYALELEIEIVLPEFINFYCQTNDFKSQLNLLVKHAVNQVSFAKAELDHIAVPLPDLPEQHEIVRRVDALFALVNSIEAKVAAAREKTAKLRQSILAKAFSGELVPTEAELARLEGRDYEPADVLLERIEAEQEKSGKKVKAAK